MDNTARVCIVSNTSYYVCSTSPCILEQFRLRHEKKSLGCARAHAPFTPVGPWAAGVVNLRVLGWAMDSSMSRLTAGRLDACL